MQEKGDYNVFIGDYKCMYKIKTCYLLFYLLGMECVRVCAFICIYLTKQKQCLQGNTQLWFIALVDYIREEKRIEISGLNIYIKKIGKELIKFKLYT